MLYLGALKSLLFPRLKLVSQVMAQHNDVQSQMWYHSAIQVPQYASFFQGLRFVATKDHFTLDGDMKLKCTASIGNVYWQSNEKSAEGFKHKRASLGSDFDKRNSYLPGK